MTPADLLAISRELNVRAFLRAVRACEGTAAESGYTTLFGYETFDSFADHPRRVVRKGGYSSSAAGAYQIIKGTWDGLVRQYAFPDFSPESQDAAAVALILGRGALEDVRAGLLAEAVRKCAKEWASLPGSPYGQPRRTMAYVTRVYLAHGGSLAHQPEKPMAPFVAAALPAIVSAIPQLAKLFGSGSAVSERNAQAAEAVVSIVQQAVGASNAQDAAERVQSDPVARQQAAEAVQAKWFDLVEAGGGGIAGARKFNTDVAASAAWRMPAVWISAALLALVFMVVGTVLWAPGWSNDIRLQVVTAVLTVIGMVGSFWLGTSAGSQRKTDLLAEK